MGLWCGRVCVYRIGSVRGVVSTQCIARRQANDFQLNARIQGFGKGFEKGFGCPAVSCCVDTAGTTTGLFIEMWAMYVRNVESFPMFFSDVATS